MGKQELALVPSKYFDFTKVGVEIRPDTPIEEWLRIGEVLKKANMATQWWIGDWLNFGERVYGETYSQALEATDYEYKTLRNFAWVAGKVEMSLRKDNLSFGHYNILASLEARDQKKWLKTIEKDDLTIGQLRNELRKERISKPSNLPKGKYNVIYADPPWAYDFAYEGMSGSVANHYPTLSAEEVADYKDEDGKQIKDLADENAVLFLWITNPKLNEVWPIIEKWGFEYKTNMVWVKDIAGQGFYVKGQHELMLICVKGSFRTDDSLYIRSVVQSDRLEHSQKPKVFYEIIEKMYPNGKYIELFARNTRKGWDSWGNQTEKYGV